MRIEKENEREGVGTLKFAVGGSYVGVKKKKKVKDFKGLSEDEIERLKGNYEETKNNLSLQGQIIEDLGVYVKGLNTPNEDELEPTTLILLHYYGGSAIENGCGCCWSNSDILRFSNACRCRIIVPDLPGHGGSLGKISSKPVKSNLTSITKSFILPLLNHFSCGSKTIIYGYDFGGGLALNISQVLKERFEGIIVHNGSYRLEGGREDFMFRKGEFSEQDELVEFSF